MESTQSNIYHAVMMKKSTDADTQWAIFQLFGVKRQTRKHDHGLKHARKSVTKHRRMYPGLNWKYAKVHLAGPVNPDSQELPEYTILEEEK